MFFDIKMELRFYFETTVNRIYLKRKTIGVRLVLFPEWVKPNHVLNSIFHRLMLLQMTIKLTVTMYTCNLCLSIHLIPKWRPIKYSFVCMLISPLGLVIMYKKQKNFEVKMTQRGLINMQTKE